MTSLSSNGEATDISVPAYERAFQTLKNETSVAALDVEGHIPDWLTGTLLPHKLFGCRRRANRESDSAYRIYNDSHSKRRAQYQQQALQVGPRQS